MSDFAALISDCASAEKVSHYRVALFALRLRSTVFTEGCNEFLNFPAGNERRAIIVRFAGKY